MSFLSRMRSTKSSALEHAPAPSIEDVEIQNVTNDNTTEEKNDATAIDDHGDTDLKDEIEAPTQDAQLGVQKIEAITLAWTKRSLAALLIMIWILFLTNGFRLSILWGLVP
ncbi:hypothetical protein LTR84_008576 [Exophiala bonariae]|uniref:Major facilitator superfamily (MFS) profile domain-containing protein n=1 Tax=Exophiala bonariae TaxID=1690606 RepID=A0AAV9MXV4_9EURO|nr:hypothetical protein LTR84_008576 [Exophiala bonariae]